MPQWWPSPTPTTARATGRSAPTAASSPSGTLPTSGRWAASRSTPRSWGWPRRSRFPIRRPTRAGSPTVARPSGRHQLFVTAPGSVSIAVAELPVPPGRPLVLVDREGDGLPPQGCHGDQEKDRPDGRPPGGVVHPLGDLEPTSVDGERVRGAGD